MSEFKKGDIVIITDESLIGFFKSRIAVIAVNIEPYYKDDVIYYELNDRHGNRNYAKFDEIKPIDYSNIVVMVDNEEEYNEIAQILGMTTPYNNLNLIYPDCKKQGSTGNSKIGYTPLISAIYGNRDCIDYSEFMYFLKGYYAPEKETYILSDSVIAIQKHASTLIESERVYINSLVNLKSILQKEIDNIDNKLKELNNGKA